MSEEWELCVHMANELYPMSVKKRRKYIEECMKDDAQTLRELRKTVRKELNELEIGGPVK